MLYSKRQNFIGVLCSSHKLSFIGGVHDFETHHGVKYNTEEAGKVAKSYH